MPGQHPAAPDAGYLMGASRRKRVTSALLLWTLAAAQRVTRAVAAQCRSIFSSGLHGRVELRVPPEGGMSVFSFC
jgi:hypothetical protein